MNNFDEIKAALRTLGPRGLSALKKQELFDVILGINNVEEVVEEVVEEHNDCPICIDSLTNATQHTTSCGHTYHKTCIEKWLTGHSNCPLCRAQIVAQPQSSWQSRQLQRLEEVQRQNIARWEELARWEAPMMVGWTEMRERRLARTARRNSVV